MTNAMHLVYLQRPWLDQVLAGTKNSEFRVSKTRQPWWQTVYKGDLLLFCHRGRVHGMAEVQRAEWFSGSDTETALCAQYGERPYWAGRAPNYAAVFHFGPVCPVSEMPPPAHGAPAAAWRLCLP